MRTSTFSINFNNCYKKAMFTWKKIINGIQASMAVFSMMLKEEFYMSFQFQDFFMHASYRIVP